MSARTWYDGVPDPNRHAWSTAGMKVSCVSGISSHSVIQGIGCLPSVVRRGHHDADDHKGTIKVPSSLLAHMWETTLGIEYGGGKIQLFSPLQFTVNASAASEQGLSHLLQNLGI